MRGQATPSTPDEVIVYPGDSHGMPEETMGLFLHKFGSSRYALDDRLVKAINLGAAEHVAVAAPRTENV
jgi:hypothetical protein